MIFASQLHKFTRPALAVLLGAGLLACGGERADYNAELASQLERRRGEPPAFFVNESPYAAARFRREIYFERRHFEGEFGHPSPEEFRELLDEYIEESIMLNEALAQTNFNTPEAREYLWPFIRRGMIAYYLEKESGAHELAANYEDIDVPDEVADRVLEERGEELGDGDSARVRIENTARRLKYERLRQAAERRKTEILSRIKRDTRVRILPAEAYRPE